MQKKRFLSIFILFLFCYHYSTGQAVDEVRMPGIHTVLFTLAGNQQGYPVTAIGETGTLDLSFDDFDMYAKSYSYTYQLCDADWQPVNMSSFDYLAGYTQNRILNYQASAIAKTRYMHYSISLPEKNCLPSKTGNYILKVFLNGDTSQLAFARRLLVTDAKVPIAATVQQPFNPDKWKTHQKIQFTVDVSRLQVLNPQQQIKVVVLQNFRWDNALSGLQPAFMRGSQYEYNGERDALFPAGKEYRWIDLSSFRFVSDRVHDIDLNTVPFTVNAITDKQRVALQYLPYQDYNGFYFIRASESIDPAWQGDYANVHFSYANDDKSVFPDKNVYIVGQFNNYRCDASSRLQYNPASGVYETSLLLKQGYYTYAYVTRDERGMAAVPQDAYTEGDYWETENNYTILVYYRSLSNRYDELVGLTTINSRLNNTSL